MQPGFELLFFSFSSSFSCLWVKRSLRAWMTPVSQHVLFDLKGSGAVLHFMTQTAISRRATFIAAESNNMNLILIPWQHNVITRCYNVFFLPYGLMKCRYRQQPAADSTGDEGKCVFSPSPSLCAPYFICIRRENSNEIPPFWSACFPDVALTAGTGCELG